MLLVILAGLIIALLVRQALVAEERSSENELFSVFESGDPLAFATAKAALDSAGIRYVTQGEGVQDLFGLGRLGIGYNNITGPPRICVPAGDVEDAREVLDGFAT